MKHNISSAGISSEMERTVSSNIVFIYVTSQTGIRETAMHIFRKYWPIFEIQIFCHHGGKSSFKIGQYW